jgi:hypothetical protein
MASGARFSMLAFVFLLAALLFWFWEWVVPLRVFFFPVYCKSVLCQEARDRNQIPHPFSPRPSWEQTSRSWFFCACRKPGHLLLRRPLPRHHCPIMSLAVQEYCQGTISALIKLTEKRRSAGRVSSNALCRHPISGDASGLRTQHRTGSIREYLRLLVHTSLL